MLLRKTVESQPQNVLLCRLAGLALAFCVGVLLQLLVCFLCTAALSVGFRAPQNLQLAAGLHPLGQLVAHADRCEELSGSVSCHTLAGFVHISAACVILYPVKVACV